MLGTHPSCATHSLIQTQAYGLNLSCPSPTTLHVGVPNNVIIPTSGDGCHLWLRLNELFSKVFSHCPQRNTSSTLARIDQFEVGLLYMGIKNGWDSLSLSLSQSPALTIIKEVDQAAFSHLPKTCRLATLYKSFKLLKVGRFARAFSMCNHANICFSIISMQQRNNLAKCPLGYVPGKCFLDPLASSLSMCSIMFTNPTRTPQHVPSLDTTPHHSRLLRLAHIALALPRRARHPRQKLRTWTRIHSLPPLRVALCL